MSAHGAIFLACPKRSHHVDICFAKMRRNGLLTRYASVFTETLFPGVSRFPCWNGEHLEGNEYLSTGQIAAQLSTGRYVFMYVYMVITYSKVWINQVKLPILLVVS